MPKIQVNFDKVPDVVQPVRPGIRTLECVSAEITETAAKTGQKLVIEWRVNEEGDENHGRKLFDHISLKMETRLKRAALACGLTVGADGYDTSDLIGRTCKARVENRTYQDQQTQETKETSSIKDYLIPGDAA